MSRDGSHRAYLIASEQKAAICTLAGAIQHSLVSTKQSLAADGAIAWFSSNFYLVLNADRAPQRKASVGHLSCTIMTDLNEPLTVDIDLKESDLQRANFWFGLTGWSNRLTLILITLGGLLLLFRIAPSTVFPNSIALILSLVMLGFLPFYFGFIWFQTKRSFQNLQDFQKKIQFTFTPDG